MESKFRRQFRDELDSSVCLFTDGSRSEGSPFSGYSLVSLDGRYVRRFCSVGFVSSFCVETMAIVEALRLV